MAIILLYSFRIVSARRDRVSARRDLPFQFDKSQNLLISIIFGFKMIIFKKFIMYCCFLVVFIILLSFSIKFELQNDNNGNKFIKNYRFTIILG